MRNEKNEVRSKREKWIEGGEARESERDKEKKRERERARQKERERENR